MGVGKVLVEINPNIEIRPRKHPKSNKEHTTEFQCDLRDSQVELLYDYMDYKVLR